MSIFLSIIYKGTPKMNCGTITHRLAKDVAYLETFEGQKFIAYDFFDFYKVERNNDGKYEVPSGLHPLSKISCFIIKKIGRKQKVVYNLSQPKTLASIFRREMLPGRILVSVGV